MKNENDILIKSQGIKYGGGGGGGTAYFFCLVSVFHYKYLSSPLEISELVTLLHNQSTIGPFYWEVIRLVMQVSSFGIFISNYIKLSQDCVFSPIACASLAW